jgi:hypothetical protein
MIQHSIERKRHCRAQIKGIVCVAYTDSSRESERHCWPTSRRMAESPPPGWRYSCTRNGDTPLAWHSGFGILMEVTYELKFIE